MVKRFAAMLAFAGLASGAAGQAQRAGLPAGLHYLHVHEPSAHGGFELDVVSVDLCNATLSPRVSAPDEGGRTVSAWANEVGAAVAVNGDYFDEHTLQPLGPTRGAGHDWRGLRHEHRDALLAFDRDAQPHLLEAPDSAQPTLWADAATQLQASWTDMIAVRERVLRDGVVRESPAITHDGERHPRTALALSADRHTLWFVVADGRSERSAGATTDELANALVHLGARDGMKLDGGGSSALFVRGRGVVNHPSDGRERVVANHIGIVSNGGTPARRAWCGPPVTSRARETRPHGAPVSAWLALLGVMGFAMALSRPRGA